MAVEVERVYRGLSPRVRGNRVFANSLTFRERSIPACAGEPFCDFLAESTGAVYPRVCGGTHAG